MLLFSMQSLLDNFNNFNSYLAILSAIESSPISRLDWPDKVLKVSTMTESSPISDPLKLQTS